MIVPLQYQISEFDCGPTSLMNAVSYLFDRRKIRPDLIKGIYRYCLDGFSSKGEAGCTGTGKYAMEFMSHWFNQYASQRRFPIRSEVVPQEKIEMAEGNAILDCLNNGGCALLRCYLCCGHYVLLTAAEDGRIGIFDPYFLERPLRRRDIEMVYDQPTKLNRWVPFARLNRTDKDYYAMGPQDERECLLLFNTEREASGRNAAEGKPNMSAAGAAAVGTAAVGTATVVTAAVGTATVGAQSDE